MRGQQQGIRSFDDDYGTTDAPVVACDEYVIVLYGNWDEFVDYPPTAQQAETRKELSRVAVHPDGQTVQKYYYFIILFII